MSEFKIRVQDLYGIMDSTEALEAVLQQAADGVQSVKRGLRAQVRQRERIDSRLVSTIQQLEKQRQSVGRIVSVGRQAAGLYQDTERALLGLKPGTVPEKGGDGEEKIPFAMADLFPLKDLWKLVGEAGVAGRGFKLGTSLGSAEWWDAGKDVAKLVGNAAKLADKAGTPEWEGILREATGWTKRTAVNGIGDSFSQQLGKYKIGQGQSTAKNVAACAKWAGDIITVAETGASNWNEFKEDGGWTNPRLYAETALESALKIGSGLAIGAAVAACAPAGATALAVGAATVAVTAAANWALDGVSQVITGNSDGWVENLSDGVINLGKAVGDGAKQAGKSVAKWWKDIRSKF